MLELNNIYNIDCIEGMSLMESESVDLILSDLPYGVTAKNKWDNVIPFDMMWREVNRVIKPNGAIIFFGQDKFTAKLMLSNEKMHRYNIIWEKGLTTGFLNANKMPLRSHEDIIVFYKKTPTYNPQRVKGKKSHSRGKATGKEIKDYFNNNNYGEYKLSETESDMKFPTSVWHFQKVHPSKCLHPTQKPLDLCRYIIKTYSNEGDLVLDFCCGSGTTPLAAKIEGRNYIGIDNGYCDHKQKNTGRAWADIAKERIAEYDYTAIEPIKYNTAKT